MRSNRIALIAVVAGTALLGSAAAGVTTVSHEIASRDAAAPPVLEVDFHHEGFHRHHGRGL